MVLSGARNPSEDYQTKSLTHKDNMTQIINFSEIVESNGKTIRENNLTQKHKYPIGTLVEFEVNHWEDPATLKGTARAFVCSHQRDCDGSPLYTMSMWDPKRWGCIGPDYSPEKYNAMKYSSRDKVLFEGLFMIWFFSYGEESLTPIKDL
jgi:hypothetical protein